MIKPLVVIPSYNSGELLLGTVRDALANAASPVWVVIDGSTDGSGKALLDVEKSESRLKVIVKRKNEGKGAAVRSALLVARRAAYTHVLVMDADGQHPADYIERFFEYAKANPEAMVLGQPVFDKSVPLERLYGRKLSVFVVLLEVGGRAIGDPLYGFRVYPLEALLEVMKKPGRSDRYDFDPEVAVRLNWMGIPSVKVEAPVRYISKESGGVSHFHYLRDNIRFVGLHMRLLLQAPFRLMLKGLGVRSSTSI